MTATLRPRRLVSVGSIIADLRIDVPHLPPRGGDVIGSSGVLSAGGGFNVLAAAARNGLACAFAGRHGTGPYGARIRADLARENITALLPPSPEGDSGLCTVLVEPDGERTFVTSPGVESQLGERTLSHLELAASDAVFVSGYDLFYPTLGPEIARWSGELAPEILLVVDLGPLVADIPADIRDAALSRTSILTLNRREATLLAGVDGLDGIVRAVLPRLADGALLIVRDGAAGCFLLRQGSGAPVRIGAPSVQMVDSTGAGDAHTGVLIAALASGLDPISAAIRANAAAALSVTRRGPATAPTTAELDAFLAARAQCVPDHTWPRTNERQPTIIREVKS